MKKLFDLVSKMVASLKLTEDDCMAIANGCYY